eukprot:scaffold56059_cov31-Tisochrysis_lutea.AAC.1
MAAAIAAATNVPADCAVIMRAYVAASARAGAATEASATMGKNPKPVPRDVRTVCSSKRTVVGCCTEPVEKPGECGERTSNRETSDNERATAPMQIARIGGGAILS